MVKQLSWAQYVSKIAKQEDLTHQQAMVVASKSWADYKAKMGHGEAKATEKLVEVKETKRSVVLDPSDLRTKPISKAKAKKMAVEDGDDETTPKKEKKPRKPRVTKAQKQADEMEKLRLKAELLEAQIKLQSKEKAKVEKKVKPASRKRKVVKTVEVVSDSDSD